MRILVTGSRDWPYEHVLYAACLEAVIESDDELFDTVIVHGACPTGADALADKITWATKEPHKADWAKYGRRAGPKRNAEMVALGADVCLAFIGPCTSPQCSIEGAHPSHGASGCADLAEKAGIETRRFTL